MNTNTLHKHFFFTALAALTTLVSIAQSSKELPQTISFSYVKGKESRPKTIYLPTIKSELKKKDFKVVGKDSADFKIVPINGQGDHTNISISFQPVPGAGQL